MYDAFYKLTDSKSQVCHVYTLLAHLCCLAAPAALVCRDAYQFEFLLQIRSYVFDVVRGTVPKINLDDVFTVSNPDVIMICSCHYSRQVYLDCCILLLRCALSYMFCKHPINAARGTSTRLLIQSLLACVNHANPLPSHTNNTMSSSNIIVQQQNTHMVLPFMLMCCMCYRPRRRLPMK